MGSWDGTEGSWTMGYVGTEQRWEKTVDNVKYIYETLN